MTVFGPFAGAPVPDDVWAAVLPMIERVIPRLGGTHDADDVRAGIECGTYQLWTGADSVIVTEVIAYPKLTALNYWLIAGSMAGLLAMQLRIDGWARSMGCVRVQGAGRKGWVRALPGWAEIGYWYERAL